MRAGLPLAASSLRWSTSSWSASVTSAWSWTRTTRPQRTSSTALRCSCNPRWANLVIGRNEGSPWTYIPPPFPVRSLPISLRLWDPTPPHPLHPPVWDNKHWYSNKPWPWVKSAMPDHTQGGKHWPSGECPGAQHGTLNENPYTE